MSPSRITVESLPSLLQDDDKVKVAGIDVDGILRGKIISKKKFLSVAENGFGFCSVIFGWDMHDVAYVHELGVSNQASGYRDILAIPDLDSFRRIPWEDNVPLFLVSFYEPGSKKPLGVCPRGLLALQMDKLKERDLGAMAGAEYEFYQFKTPDGDDTSPALFLRHNPPHKLPSLTEGMFGYSLTRPVQNKDYYYDVFDTCVKFGCSIEGWHAESGPGVFEAALEYAEVKEMADRASLFKLAVKSTATKYGITPCFMAKPRQGLPGSSGHVHVSLVDGKGNNVLARDHPDPNAEWRDLAHISDLGRHFLAGILAGLPDVMPMLAPTVNSYKRLVENFWAPVTVSWGLENRSASVRLIAPPMCKPSATRFEVRVAGADANPYFVLAAVVGLGWRGVEKKLDITIAPGLGEDDPPNTIGESGGEENPKKKKKKEESGDRLAKDLKEATRKFVAEGSVAREVFGDGFVNHFGGTREHEARLFDEAVTDWEMKRYIETV